MNYDGCKIDAYVAKVRALVVAAGKKGTTFSAVRCGEYKMMLASTTDDDRDIQNSGGFSGVTQKYTYSRLYNLYLDPKEQHSYLTRKLAYNEAFLSGLGEHLRTYRDFPPKKIV